MTKGDAARQLRELAGVIRLSLDGDEGAEGWADELDRIADSLDKQRPGVRIGQDGEPQYSSEWLNDR